MNLNKLLFFIKLAKKTIPFKNKNLKLHGHVCVSINKILKFKINPAKISILILKKSDHE